MKILDQVLAQSLGYSRLALYTLESLPILYSRRLLGLQNQPHPTPPEDHLRHLSQVIPPLIEEDAKNIKQGLYPSSLLLPEKPKQHLRRYWDIFKDSLEASYRAKKKLHQDFSEESRKFAESLPEYYVRNFHFQTDGYLSESSAELYSHQTEILFKGTLGLMRRVLMAPLLRHLQRQGRPLRVLELGCGAGEATEVLLRSCPNVELVSIDLSRPYLQAARKRLCGFSNVRFEFADAADFESREKFDAVFSVFLFHELPEEVRRQVMLNSSVLLRSGGWLFHIDSLQLGDTREFDWALLQFPKDFHEPFYKNYIQKPLRSFFPKSISFHQERIAFLSKSVWGVKVDSD